MSDLPSVLRELRSLRLRPEDWDDIDRALTSLDADDPAAPDLAQVVFEAKVHGRFAGPRASGDVVPTKQTSVLPMVGLVCGGLLVGVGALLGGGWILVGIGVLGAFVFGVAFAGSRVAHRRSDDAPGSGGSEDTTPVPIPDHVALRVHALLEDG